MCLLVCTWEKYFWEIKKLITVTASSEDNWVAEDWGENRPVPIKPCKAFEFLTLNFKGMNADIHT